MKKKKLPKFKSEEEETHFWDTHSPLDYPGEFVDVKEPSKFVPALLRKVARRRLEALAMKEKGKEKPVTKKFIDSLKKARKSSKGE